MEQWEFHELTEVMVNRFLPRVPAKYVDGFESMLDGGEFSMAVDDLVLTLVNNKVPVTDGERDDLRRLLDYLKQPTSTLDDLTVASQP